MRILIALIISMLAGCGGQDGVFGSEHGRTSTLNYQPGKYRDFADYMLDKDPELLADAAKVGAGREQAHCVAKSLGRYVHGADYEILSQAVSGRRHLSYEEELRAQRQQSKFGASMANNKEAGRKLLDGIWAGCMNG